MAMNHVVWPATPKNTPQIARVRPWPMRAQTRPDTAAESADLAVVEALFVGVDQEVYGEPFPVDDAQYLHQPRFGAPTVHRPYDLEDSYRPVRLTAHAGTRQRPYLAATAIARAPRETGPTSKVNQADNSNGRARRYRAHPAKPFRRFPERKPYTPLHLT
jgi:hypothetical protein